MKKKKLLKHHFCIYIFLNSDNTLVNMLITYHKPLGDPKKTQDSLPNNWKELAKKGGDIPRRFNVVEEGKLYRSGIVWPHQVKKLQTDYGVEHIISLLDGDWLEEFYDDPFITIHRFPIMQRKELNYNRIKRIVEVINELEGFSLVH